MNPIYTGLIDLGAMKGYESRKGICGVFPLLTSFWVADYSLFLNPNTLEKAILNSNHWDPKRKVVIRFFKQAVSVADIGNIQVLLKHGFDVHERESGVSAIEDSCASSTSPEFWTNNDARKVLQCLLDHSLPKKLEEFSTDQRACPILHRLATSEPIHGVKWFLQQLVDKGADINAVNLKAFHLTRTTPLVWHLKQKSYQCAKLLLQLGANPLLTEETDEANMLADADALDAAVLSSCPSFLRQLLVYAKLNSIKLEKNYPWNCRVKVNEELVEMTGCTHLHVSSHRGDLECVQVMLEEGLMTNIDSVSDQGLTALHCASIGGRPQIIEYLVQKGSYINTQDTNGRTPLYYAAIQAHASSVDTLLRLGAHSLAETHIQNTHEDDRAAGGNVATSLLEKWLSQSTKLSCEDVRLLTRQLGRAIERGSLEECQSLHSSGCPIDEPISGVGRRPLAYALWSREYHIAEWLLDIGADTVILFCDHVPVSESMTLIEWLAGCKRPPLASILPRILQQYLEQGGFWYDWGIPIHYAAAENNLKGLETILTYIKANGRRIGKSYQMSSENVLQYLVNRIATGNVEIAKLLLDNKAEPDKPSKDGRSALDMTSFPPLVEVLLEAGASPSSILTRGLGELLSLWGHRCTNLVNMYHEYYMKHLGIQFVDLLDLSIPSAVYHPIRLHYFAGLDTLESLQRMGFDLTSLSHGCGDYVNQAVCLYPRLQSWLLNSGIGLESLTPIPWEWVDHRGFKSSSMKLPFLDRTFRHFRRRLPETVFERWLNLQPSKGWSPLCRAASLGSVTIVENCLSVGAEIDFEGCSLGSALIIASACGKLDVVKILVRKGAAIGYIGRRGPIDAVSVARSNVVRSWLLVRRFSDLQRLKDSDSDVSSGDEIKLWSGILKARYVLRGRALKHASESMLEYARRLRTMPIHYESQNLAPIDGLQYPI
ncbi:hypothetical protein FSARC_3401 [Fusarium sarcochroum]|uniref:Ankyrin n=1 Tax=Fusarium sarcochroum TaxID=1208366 RepID=A0A8H4U443_9HYPO|nr:hypothetical protein FSARC_3401 [Fusarium sarcochroum]